MASNVREFRGIAADSRDIGPGFLFAALPGTKVDGAHYIAEAVRRGATAVLGVPAAAEDARAAGVRFIADANPRLRLAQLAAEFYGTQPKTIAAVTGTNGKTSVAVFLRQIWSALGRQAASLGTLGIDAPSGHASLGHTTPDPVVLHAALARLAGEGVACVAMEASSHGLDQFRLDGVAIAAAGFTNITRDHLDYHPDFAHYLASKLRLFDDLVQGGGVAVINADSANAAEFIAVAMRRKLALITIGERGETLRLLRRSPEASGQIFVLRYDGQDHTIHLPLVGSFQASNALVAAGLAIGLGDPASAVFAALEKLQGAPGRLQLVAWSGNGAAIYVDYAHTPDAIETVLTALRPHVGGRLHIVFGCGGDRDRGKRPLMGAAARRLADSVIVTDDNPRSEKAEDIRREVLSGCPDARDIADRAAAIAEAIAELAVGDALVIAGKGHEEGQIIGTQTWPFSDRAEAIKAAVAVGGRAAGTLS